MKPSGQKFNKVSGQWNISPYMPKPSYYSTDGSSIVIPASSTKPFYIWLSNELYKVESNITIKDLDVGSLAANTPYYVYMTSSSGGVLSKNDPDTGPTGYDAWTYIGACATDSGGSTFTTFRAANGCLIAGSPIESESHTGGTTANQETWASMPLTVVSAWMQCKLNFAGAVVGQRGAIGPNNDNTFTNHPLYCISGENGDGAISVGWVPVIEVLKALSFDDQFRTNGGWCFNRLARRTVAMEVGISEMGYQSKAKEA